MIRVDSSTDGIVDLSVENNFTMILGNELNIFSDQLLKCQIHFLVSTVIYSRKQTIFEMWKNKISEHFILAKHESAFFALSRPNN